jgi:hypothetical protein
VRDDPSRTSPEARSESAEAPLRPTSPTIAVSECPLCTQRFTDNEELNEHIAWCLSPREATRSAQGESDRRKPEGGVRDLKEWWKVRSGEERLEI